MALDRKKNKGPAGKCQDNSSVEHLFPRARCCRGGVGLISRLPPVSSAPRVLMYQNVHCGSRPLDHGGIHRNSLRPVKAPLQTPGGGAPPSMRLLRVNCQRAAPYAKFRLKRERAMPGLFKIFFLFPLPVKVTTRSDKKHFYKKMFLPAMAASAPFLLRGARSRGETGGPVRAGRGTICPGRGSEPSSIIEAQTSRTSIFYVPPLVLYCARSLRKGLRRDKRNERNYVPAWQIGGYLNIHYATASRAVKRIVEERKGKGD